MSTDKIDQIRSGLAETMAEHFYTLVDILRDADNESFDAAFDDLEVTIDGLTKYAEKFVELGVWADTKRVSQQRQFAEEVLNDINAL